MKAWLVAAALGAVSPIAAAAESSPAAPAAAPAPAAKDAPAPAARPAAKPPSVAKVTAQCYAEMTGRIEDLRNYSRQLSDAFAGIDALQDQYSDVAIERDSLKKELVEARKTIESLKKCAAPAGPDAAKP